MSANKVATSAHDQRDEEWNSLRLAIRELYILQKMNLKDLVCEMSSRYGFNRPKWEYEAKLKQWKFYKNIPKQNYAYIDDRARKLQREGKGVSVYLSGVKKQWKPNVLAKKRRDNFYYSYASRSLTPESPKDINIAVLSPFPQKEFYFEYNTLPWYQFLSHFRPSSLPLPSGHHLLVANSPEQSILRLILPLPDSVQETTNSKELNRTAARLVNLSLLALPLQPTHDECSESSSDALRYMRPSNFLEQLLFLLSNDMLDEVWTAAADQQLLDFIQCAGFWKYLRTTLQGPERITTQAILEKVCDSAVRLGDVPAIKMCLDAGASIDRSVDSLYHRISVHEYYISPLHMAILLGDSDLVMFLLSRGAIISDVQDTIRKAITNFDLNGESGDEIMRFILSEVPSLTENQCCKALEYAATWQISDVGSILLEFLTPGCRSPELISCLLIYSIKTGDEALVRQLLEESPNFKLDGRVGIRALQVAIMQQKTEICGMLLRRGGTAFHRFAEQYFQRKPPFGQSPATFLQCAAYTDNTEILDMLLLNGTDINFQVPGKSTFLNNTIYPWKTALDTALHASSSSATMYLLQKGAKLTGRELVMAAKNGMSEVLDWLLELGMHLEEEPFWFKDSLEAAVLTVNFALIDKIIEQDSRKITPGSLCAAVYMDIARGETSTTNVSLVQIILKRGRKHLGDGLIEGLALYLAARNHRVDIVRLLLKSGLRPLSLPVPFLDHPWHEYISLEAWVKDYQAFQIQEHYSWPVIKHISTKQCTTEILELLLDHGYQLDGTCLGFLVDSGTSLKILQSLQKDNCLDSNQRNEYGRSALPNAIERERWDIVDWLLANDVNVNAVPNSCTYQTALQAAVAAGNLELVDLLIIRGADINAAPLRWYGATAFQYASMYGYFRIAEKLFTLNANINAPAFTVKGRTALEGAAENGHIDMISFLLGIPVATTGSCQRQYIRAVVFAQRHGHDAAVSLLRAHRPWDEQDDELFEMEYANYRDIFLVFRTNVDFSYEDSVDEIDDTDINTGLGFEDQEVSDYEEEVGSHELGILPNRENCATTEEQSKGKGKEIAGAAAQSGESVELVDSNRNLIENSVVEGEGIVEGDLFDWHDWIIEKEW